MKKFNTCYFRRVPIKNIKHHYSPSNYIHNFFNLLTILSHCSALLRVTSSTQLKIYTTHRTLNHNIHKYSSLIYIYCLDSNKSSLNHGRFFSTTNSIGNKKNNTRTTNPLKKSLHEREKNTTKNQNFSSSFFKVAGHSMKEYFIFTVAEGYNLLLFSTA